MKEGARNSLILMGISGLVIGLDQWTKYLVQQNLQIGEFWAPFPAIGSFFRFLHWHNTGAAFGIFQNANTILMILSAVVAIVIVVVYHKMAWSDMLARVALALQFGGAIGNLIDRIRQGYVTDFVAVGNFPIFNVADSAVTVGVGLLLLAMIIEEKLRKCSAVISDDLSSSVEEN
ncbi:MAG: signal peptidase II [Anaerolineaceae bacterium]|jgi:signal peptidase II